MNAIITPLQNHLREMNHSSHNQPIAFIWRIADDHLRDVYVRGK